MIAFFKKRVSAVSADNKVEKKYTIIRDSSCQKTSRYGHQVLVELPPSRRMIFVDHRGYFVSLPSIRFSFNYWHNPVKKSLFIVEQMYVCFFNNDQILIPSFPNIHSNFKVCISTCSGATLEEMIENQINKFFSTAFDLAHTSNHMYIYYPFRFLNDGFFHSYMQRWGKKTKKRPKWINNNFRKIRLFASKRFPQFF